MSEKVLDVTAETIATLNDVLTTIRAGAGNNVPPGEIAFYESSVETMRERLVELYDQGQAFFDVATLNDF